MPITDTVRAILTEAAARTDHLALLPSRLPAAAQRAVAQSMLRAGLLAEIAADDEQPAWRTAEDGQRLCLRITNTGLDALGAVAADIVVEPTAKSPVRSTLRAAAQALLAAWNDPDVRRPLLPDAVDALRAALSDHPRRSSPSKRQPRRDTKRSAVLSLLRRPEGATVTQVAEATGWARHTVHGFFAGLKKGGLPIEVLERVKQAGTGQGAKGSYTIYRVAEGG